MDNEFEELKKRIEKLEKLVNYQEKKIKYIWINSLNVDEWPSLDNLKLIEENKNPKFELCVLHQSPYGDRYGSWIENEFKPIGFTKFQTKEEVLDYLNGDPEKMDEEHYIQIHEGNRKIYLHDIERNIYKRFRKNPNGEFYLK